jgi:transposase
MSLRPTPVPEVPEETARVARAAFPKGHPYLTMRDLFGVFFQDEAFAALYPQRGQPGEAPWRLAIVTLLQFAEGLSDQQAADAVRSRIDWKYLLGLELTHPGFDPSVLCEFRTRLLEHSEAAATERAAEHLLLDTLLTQCRERKLLRARGIQRTDATHVLAAVRQLNRLELVGETLRYGLNTLAEEAPAWLRAHSDPEWPDRYGRRFEESRLPQSAPERAALAQTIGEDGMRLLAALWSDPAGAALREHPAVETLRQVWVQQFYREDETLRFRCPEELPPAAGAISSPYDTEARYGKKRQTEWVGYKVHLTETCDPDQPLLITDVQTTTAPIGDTAVLPQIREGLQARGLLPRLQLVDGAYMKGEEIVASQQYGIDLVGRPLEDTHWQAQAQTGFAARDFTIDWAARSVVCPQGKSSVGWYDAQLRGEAVIQVVFADRECQACPWRSECTRAAKKGRRLQLRSQPVHEALVVARARAATEAFVITYAARAGVEGTHNQAIRRCGMRQGRYVGLEKVHLQHVITAAALNFVRVAAWLMATPRARTRQSAYLRLMAAA